MDKKEHTRMWVSEYGEGFLCHPKCCLFCDNCTDIFYDLSGPYMVLCDKGLPQEIGFEGKCEQFVEEDPVVISKEDYIKERCKIQKFMWEHKEEIEKIQQEFIDSMLYGIPNIEDVNIGDKLKRRAKK